MFEALLRGYRELWALAEKEYLFFRGKGSPSATLEAKGIPQPNCEARTLRGSDHQQTLEADLRHFTVNRKFNRNNLLRLPCRKKMAISISEPSKLNRAAAKCVLRLWTTRQDAGVSR